MTIFLIGLVCFLFGWIVGFQVFDIWVHRPFVEILQKRFSDILTKLNK